MKKPERAAETTENDDLLPEYGPEVFARGVRGKYYAAYQSGTNLARLEPDVRASFPSDEAVNEALRLLINVAGRTGAKGS